MSEGRLYGKITTWGKKISCEKHAAITTINTVLENKVENVVLFLMFCFFLQINLLERTEFIIYFLNGCLELPH